MPARRTRAICAPIIRAAVQLGKHTVHILMPPTCPITDDPVDALGSLSASAWTTLRFLTPPWCSRCGTPFAYDMGEGAVCHPCVRRKSPLDILRAPLAYDDASKPLILRIKHAGRLDGVAMMGRWMAHALRDIPISPHRTIITPVPLHPSRLRQRKYNQSALLAEALGTCLDIPIAHVLTRHRATPSQAGMTARDRARNVAGAFRVQAADQGQIDSLDVILVDDVYTTGATLSACARTLRRAGAARIIGLTATRVVRDGE